MVKGVFVERLTRFSVSVRVEDNIVQSFLPNPGRMTGLLISGAEVILKEVSRRNRKTSYDLIGIYHKRQKISLDSRVPNKLVWEALKSRDLPEFLNYTSIKPEYSYDHTRFDFLLRNGSKPCLLEVKSCTLIENGIAMFPDAVSIRGRRHVRDLIRAKCEGYRACILFIIQRMDARIFSPDDETDPEFGKALREAASQGVEIYSYLSEFIEDKIILRKRVEVKL
jgi:sugar fermentation stimulation protein A